MLKTSAFQIFHGGNSTFINSFDKTKFSFFILYPLVRVLPIPCIKETLCDEYIISIGQAQQPVGYLQLIRLNFELPKTNSQFGNKQL